jgi:CelD/BcsL family acetyltransferase involved in cellulose biosynthesis
MSPVRTLAAIEALPAISRRAWESRDLPGPFHGPTWFEILERTCPEAGTTPLLLADDAGGLLSVLRERRDRGRHVEAFGNFYTCEYTPLLGSLPPARQGEILVDALEALRPRVDTLHLQNMRADQVDVPALAQRLRSAGWGVQIYEQFGNWYEPVAGIGFDAYLAARDGDLRSTITRKTRRFRKLAGATLEIATAGDALERGLAAYLEVHARSWKAPEPFADFIPAFVRGFAARGELWMGTAAAQGRPLAAQIWLVWGRRITIAKLAYVDDAKALSPGTVLSAHMFRAALEQGSFDEIDLGRGDDPYKRQWLKQRRPVLGLVAGNLRTTRGALAAVRHLAPQAIKRLAGRLGLHRA